MKSETQETLLYSLSEQLNEEERQFCQPVIDHLLKLGYSPKKQKKGTYAVSFIKYGRVICKIEAGRNRRLVFWLRFSANDHYSSRFEEAVKRRPAAWIKRGQQYENHNAANCCGLCKGKPHFYHFINETGARVERCGGCTVMVPGFTAEDIPEALRLIENQDRYFNEIFSKNI